MKVVLILGGRGLRPTWIDYALDELGATVDQVDLTLVTWYPPARPLPVAEHWVVGPSPRAAVRRHEVITPVPHLPPPLVTEPAAPVDAPLATDEQGSAPVPAVDGGRDYSLLLEGDDPADPAPGATQEPIAPPAPSPARRDLAPMYNPARLRAAAGWRWRRARRAARMFYRGDRGRNTLPGRAVNKLRRLPRVQRLRADRVATQFAVATSRDARIREAVRDAVVVAGADGNSHRAAWLLARRVPGPEVVIGLPSARRVVRSHMG